MRTITKTHTGSIISDSDLRLEYLYVGDYGKENNIKADFLGYTNRIDRVEHKDVDLQEKLVVTVSSQKGCSMACSFCDCPKYGFHGNASLPELMSQISTGVALSGIKHGKRLNVHFARMGEPTFNQNVIKAAMSTTILAKEMFDEYHPVVSTMCPKNNPRLFQFLHDWIVAGYDYGGEDGFGLQFSINTLDHIERDIAFRNRSLSLFEIGDIIKDLPKPKGRKYTLNFAVTEGSVLEPELMDNYFDKNKCIVKITPIHETKEAVDNGYSIVKDFDVFERFEKPLVEDGWDVIVFVPSEEEDGDRITCGNSLIATQGVKK